MGIGNLFQSSTGSHAEDPNSPTPAPSNPPATFLGPAVRLVGALRSDHDVPIQCRIEGPVSVKGQVVVEPNGHVDGDITAGTIRVRGRTRGTLEASEQINLEPGGEHHGALRTPALVVEAGAKVAGDMRVGPGVPADEAQRSEAARAEKRRRTSA